MAWLPMICSHLRACAALGFPLRRGAQRIRQRRRRTRQGSLLSPHGRCCSSRRRRQSLSSRPPLQSADPPSNGGEIRGSKMEDGDATADAVIGDIPGEGSIHGFDSLHRLLEAYLKPEIYQEEAWMLSFALCTWEKRWCEFAEPVDGESTQFLQDLSRKYNMVIVSPILERNKNHGETIWNTYVIIGNYDNIIGKHRKNHISRVGDDFNESTCYMKGNTGHPVFETAYGKIAVNICYGRHIPLNCLAFGLDGAEIVFNPSATVGEFSEPMWPIEAHNVALANFYFVGSINHVRTEVFANPLTSGDGKPQHAELYIFMAHATFQLQMHPAPPHSHATGMGC